MHTHYSLSNLMQVIFLIGNKSDLEAQRDVTYEEAKQFADENGKMEWQNVMVRWNGKMEWLASPRDSVALEASFDTVTNMCHCDNICLVYCYMI